MVVGSLHRQTGGGFFFAGADWKLSAPATRNLARAADFGTAIRIVERAWAA